MLIMEGLDVAMEDTGAPSLFHGVNINDGEFSISHLFYADDVLLSRRSHENLNNLVCILKCFYLVSGLKTNMYKSSIYRVGISQVRF